MAGSPPLQPPLAAVKQAGGDGRREKEQEVHPLSRPLFHGQHSGEPQNQQGTAPHPQAGQETQDDPHQNANGYRL